MGKAGKRHEMVKRTYERLACERAACMSVCVSVCVYVCMYVVRMHACMHGWMDGWMHVCMYVCVRCVATHKTCLTPWQSASGKLHLLLRQRNRIFSTLRAFNPSKGMVNGTGADVQDPGHRLPGNRLCFCCSDLLPHLSKSPCIWLRSSTLLQTSSSLCSATRNASSERHWLQLGAK